MEGYSFKCNNNYLDIIDLYCEVLYINKFIEGLKQVLAGDMMSLVHLLYPEDFKRNEHEVKTLEEL